MWDQLEILRKQYLELKLQDVIDYEKFSMISIVYNSTKIEGCSLTENDTKVLLENGVTAKGKPLADHLMVKDHFNAFIYIQKKAQQKQKLTLDLLQNTAALVMKNTGGLVSAMAGDFDTSKGDFRKAQVYVDQKYFPDYSKVKALTISLFDSVNDKLGLHNPSEILKLSADIHYNLVNIHPFGDGNGRVSRLFMNYIQIYHNEPLIKIFTEDKADYIDALNTAEANKDISYFHDFICSQQMKYYKNEIDKFNKKDDGFTFMF